MSRVTMKFECAPILFPNDDTGWACRATPIPIGWKLNANCFRSSAPANEAVLVSGKGDEARAQELLKEPSVAGFIAKPFSMNRLLEKVRETIRGIEKL